MLWKLLFVAAVACLHVVPSTSLENGLVRTPPMGWLTWERFRCNTDCADDPKNCLSEDLIKEIARRMKYDGYLDAGYEYVTVDDCWPEHSRDPVTLKLVPDKKRFPNGMKYLADYVHSLGLKFGIYEDFGTKTCGGYPGSEFYMQLDADTFAEWGVDLLKFDGCNSDPKQMDEGYQTMAFFLNRTGRPIVYSCEAPVYQLGQGLKPNYAAIAKACNLWRNYNDIGDSWDSVSSIIKYYGDNKYNFSSFAGPGHWNDPDMVIVGDYGLSLTQQKAQMAMWCIMASPLIMSVDLRTIPSESKAILQNKRLIAINQDKLGIQGTRIIQSGRIEVWRKPILPSGSYAFVFLYTGTGGQPALVTYKIASLIDHPAARFQATETFEGNSLGVLGAGDYVKAFVDPTGVYMFTLTPVKGYDSVLKFKPLKAILRDRN